MYEGLATPDGGRYAPIAGVANVTTVYCNESGEWLVSMSDRYGFNNPDSVWDLGPEFDVVVIGDSVAHGMCVPTGTSAAARIQQQIPRTVNLGYNGNGPMMELASLREMSEVARGRHVVWMFFPGNDLGNLSREWETTYMSRYLEPEYSAGLVQRREIVQASLAAYLEGQIAAQTGPPPVPLLRSIYEDVSATLRLTALRERIRSNLFSKPDFPR